jgi:cold shock protein
MATSGTVVFFNLEKGYGFVEPDGGGPDVFLGSGNARKAGLKDLTAGDRITFEVEPSKNGQGSCAINLVRIQATICEGPSDD